MGSAVFVFSDLFGLKGEIDRNQYSIAHPPVCKAAMAVTDAGTIRAGKTHVEPTEACLKFERERQFFLTVIECDKVSNEPKETRRRDKNERLAAAKSEERSMQVRKCKRPRKRKKQSTQPGQRMNPFPLFTFDDEAVVGKRIHLMFHLGAQKFAALRCFSLLVVVENRARCH